MPIFQGMHLKESLRYIVVEGGCGTAFRSGIDVAIPATAAQQATQLDHGEAADRYRLSAPKKVVEFVRLRVRADIAWSKRSCQFKSGRSAQFLILANQYLARHLQLRHRGT